MSIEKIMYDHRIIRDQYSPLCACGGWRNKRDDGHGHAAHLFDLIRAELTRDEVVEAVALAIDRADDVWQHGIGSGGYDIDGPPLWLANAAIAAMIETLGGDRG